MAEIPDGATVVTVGWPDLTAMALARRGDVRVLAIDAAHHGSSFVQRLERAEVDSELVPMEAAAIATACADLVLIEADALDGTQIVAATGSAVVAAAAGLAATPVWCVAGCGRRLPMPMVTAITERVGQQSIDPWTREVETLPASLVTHVVGPPGRTTVAGRARRVRDGARTPAHRDHVGTVPRWPVAAIRSSCRTRRSPRSSTRSVCSTWRRSGRAAIPTSWRCGTRCVDGRPAFWTFAKSQKVVNLRRDPKITALVEAGDSYPELRGVELVGTARLVEDYDETLEIGRLVSARYGGDGSINEFIEAQARKRVGVVLDVERTVSWDHRKLPGGY